MRWILWRFTPILAVAIAILAAAASTARAHASLVSARPAPGAELFSSPKEISLTFNQPIGEESTLTVFDSNFGGVEGIGVNRLPDKPETLTAALPALAPGHYTVQWAVRSADGDQIGGSYAFTVTGSLLSLASDRWLQRGVIIALISVGAVVATLRLFRRWRRVPIRRFRFV
jgi:methionine-rich copper-binding protein CopC